MAIDDREKKESLFEDEEESDREIPKEDIDKALEEAEDESDLNEEDRGQEAMQEAEREEGESVDSNSLMEELETAKKESLEKQDQYVRAVAEFENFKKRVQKESIDSRKYANEGLIREILPVMDNLERALEHLDEDFADDSLVEGVRMVQKQFFGTLEKFGVSAIEALGEYFDPNFHEAMMQVTTDDSPPNIVVTEIEKGYMLNDRLVRPAKVGVSVAAKVDDQEDEDLPSDNDDSDVEDDADDGEAIEVDDNERDEVDETDDGEEILH